MTPCRCQTHRAEFVFSAVARARILWPRATNVAIMHTLLVQFSPRLKNENFGDVKDASMDGKKNIFFFSLSHHISYEVYISAKKKHRSDLFFFFRGKRVWKACCGDGSIGSRAGAMRAVSLRPRGRRHDAHSGQETMVGE